MSGTYRTATCLLALATLAACSTTGDTVQVTSEAKGSDSFSLGTPGAYKEGSGLRLTGRVCRLARSTALSPPRIRIEHVAVSGYVTETAQASVPTIYRSTDQTCRTYSARVGWVLAEGDTVRACFDRGRACPVSADTKAAVAVPASSSKPD